MTPRPAHWPAPAGRVFTCTRCRTVWEVVELPRPFIDPRLFVCGHCPDIEQLTLDPETAIRHMEMRHQPHLAVIPYAHPAAHDTEPEL